jgi:hypothetical protein
MRRIQRLAIPVVALSLFLVACGSDSDTTADESTVDTSAEVVTDDTSAAARYALGPCAVQASGT